MAGRFDRWFRAHRKLGTALISVAMIAPIGTPLDVTAEEIHIETYFPADDATEAALRGLQD